MKINALKIEWNPAQRRFAVNQRILKALPKTLTLGATAICVDALLAHALTGRRELRRTPAMRYLVQTWETLTLMLSTGEDDAAEAGTRIYEDVAA